MKRPRDVQRSKVYQAEEEAFGFAYWLDPPQFETMEETREFATWILCTDWWAERRGHSIDEVRPGRKGQCRGKAHPERGYISLPKFAWRGWYVIHELAHLVTPLGVAWHGPEFCQTYLEMLRRFGEVDQEEKLREAFRRRGVTAN